MRPETSSPSEIELSRKGLTHVMVRCDGRCGWNTQADAVHQRISSGCQFSLPVLNQDEHETDDIHAGDPARAGRRVGCRGAGCSGHLTRRLRRSPQDGAQRRIPHRGDERRPGGTRCGSQPGRIAHAASCQWAGFARPFVDRYLRTSPLLLLPA